MEVRPFSVTSFCLGFRVWHEDSGRDWGQGLALGSGVKLAEHPQGRFGRGALPSMPIRPSPSDRSLNWRRSVRLGRRLAR
jgi:hypothetical protein